MAITTTRLTKIAVMSLQLAIICSETRVVVKLKMQKQVGRSRSGHLRTGVKSNNFEVIPKMTVLLTS